MNPEAALSTYKQRVDQELERYFSAKMEEMSTASPGIQRLVEELGTFTLRGGKRFRAALIYYSYRLFGGQDEATILRLSLFIELIQSFLLIHDDIMDRSILRRGGPTLHMLYERFATGYNLGDEVHFGQSMAIIGGDVAFQWALEIVAQSEFADDRKGRLLDLIATEVTKVCFGQVQDLFLGYSYPTNHPSKEDILSTYRQKTAAYTFQLPLAAGAIAAGAGPEVMEAIKAYSLPAGVAFQITDDLLGAFGEPGRTGKSNLDDFVEGKRTLLIAEAYEQATDEQRTSIDSYLGKQDLIESEAERLRDILISTGARDYCQKESKQALKDAQKALQALEGQVQDLEAYTFLQTVTDYVVTRSQ